MIWYNGNCYKKKTKFGIRRESTASNIEFYSILPGVVVDGVVGDIVVVVDGVVGDIVVVDGVVGDIVVEGVVDGVVGALVAGLSSVKIQQIWLNKLKHWILIITVAS